MGASACRDPLGDPRTRSRRRLPFARAPSHTFPPPPAPQECSLLPGCTLVGGAHAHAACAPCLPQPPAEGESRQWEDWEYTWVPMMWSAGILYATAYYFRPYHSMDEWARARALERMAAKEGEGEDEE